MAEGWRFPEGGELHSWEGGGESGLVFDDMDTSFFLETKTLIPRFNSDMCF